MSTSLNLFWINLAIVGTIALAATSAETPDANAAITLAPGALDLGVMKPGTTTTAETWLINEGDEPVRVIDAKPSCGCTTAGIKDAVIAGHRAIRVPVTVKAPKNEGCLLYTSDAADE